jgi:VWFA-related protein
MTRERPSSPIARTCPILLAVATLSIGQAAGQGPTFRAATELVRVDVLVSDRNGPVTDLAIEDFEIRDEGVLQEIATTSVGEIPLNVVLAFDLSSSIDADKLGHLRRAGHDVLDGLKSGDRAALMTFSHRVSERYALTSDVDGLRRALGDLDPSGRTALVDGAYVALTVAEDDAGRSLAIVFSDGLDTASWLTAERVLGIAKRSDVVVYGVSVGAASSQRFLEPLTETTGGRLFAVESTRNLGAAFLEILEEFRHRYLLGYSPRGVKAGGYHRLDVQVKRRGLTVRARPGYDASKSALPRR